MNMGNAKEGPKAPWDDLVLEGGLRLRVVSSTTGLLAITFPPFGAGEGEPSPRDPIIQETARQLHAYFAGKLRQFDLPLEPQGTDFQRTVWRQLEHIPFGETRSYRQIADAVGAPKAVRAVGAANGANPIPIVLPCHRVIGSSGKLVGYGGGLELKKRLLRLEGAWTEPLY
jgi:methylated-DNA-[protein]-cysteine S-methyltransferase